MLNGYLLNANVLCFALLALAVLLWPLSASADDAPEVAIRSALAHWTQDFNGRNAEKACTLFAQDLRYDFRGYPERDYRDICDRMQRSLGDTSKTYSYDLDVREIIVSGDIAVVRLVWKLTVTLPNGQQVVSVEPGMDVFRKEPDGAWKIIRYIAYEAPERPAVPTP
jgi:ketosteroid isomerase-like protein